MTDKKEETKKRWEVQKEMQHAKYVEVKKEIEELRMTLVENTNQIKSLLILLRDMDYRFAAIGELCRRQEVFTQEEFEETCDLYRGLRMKLPEEKIENGDIVWVNYKATHDGKPFAEDGMPVRVGSGAVIFEAELVGKPCSGKVEFKKDLKGKPVEFVIEIVKVKTKIVEPKEVQDARDESRGGESQSSGGDAEAGDGSDSHAGGAGDSQPSESTNPTV